MQRNECGTLSYLCARGYGFYYYSDSLRSVYSFIFSEDAVRAFLISVDVFDRYFFRCAFVLSAFSSSCSRTLPNFLPAVLNPLSSGFFILSKLSCIFCARSFARFLVSCFCLKSFKSSVISTAWFFPSLSSAHSEINGLIHSRSSTRI